MTKLSRIKALEHLSVLNDDEDNEVEDYTAMTNEELEEEYCLSGLFSQHFPNDLEDNFEIV